MISQSIKFILGSSSLLYGSFALMCKVGYSADAKTSSTWDNNWDLLSPESFIKANMSDEQKQTKTAMATRRIILIRHGQYELDKDDDKDRILTALGRAQAEQTGKRLAEMGVTYNNLVMSTMCRAQETGNIIFEKIFSDNNGIFHGIESTDLLREGHPIDPVPYNKWKPPSWEFQDGCRIEAAFRKYIHRAHWKQNEDSCEIIVCHANVIRYFICRALQNAPEGWLRMSLANGSITEINIEPNGKVHVSCIGDKGHMPKGMITFS